uniref:Capsid protein n=1 Tax=viral metagenome TaxID=1070528 RepID=A0A2V0RCL8_9ZZZZ
MTIDNNESKYSDDVKFLKTKEAYNCYCAYAAELHNLLDLPSYEEWVNCIESENPHENFGVRAAFRARPDFGGLAGMAAGIVARNMGVDTSSADAAIRSAARILDREATKRSNGRGKFTFTDGGDGGTTKVNYSGGSAFNPQGLSLNARPIDSSWRTGIKVNYDPKYYLDGGDDTSPLMMKAFTPLMGVSSTDIDDRVQNYFESKIMSDWITYFQLNGRWNLYTQGTFSATRFKDYWNIVSQALAINYFYDSVAAHFRLDINRNEGMIDLYSQLSPSELNQLFILQNTLNSIPLPPELNEMCFKLYNNYKQSHNPGSPLIKLCPIDSMVSSDSYVTFGESNKVADIIAKMKQTSFRDVQAVLAQAKPEWATDVKLYSYTGLPNFDADFLTLFVNTEYICKTANGIVSVPSITKSADEWVYNIHTDAPDGWTQALSNVTVGLSQRAPGIGGPKTMLPGDTGALAPLIWSYTSAVPGELLATSCVIYTIDNDLESAPKRGFWPISKRTRYQSLSGNTYTILDRDPTAIGYQKFGTSRVLPMTGNTNYVAAQQLLDLIVSPNQSAGNIMLGDDSMDSDKPTRPRRRRTRK